MQWNSLTASLNVLHQNREVKTDTRRHATAWWSVQTHLCSKKDDMFWWNNLSSHFMSDVSMISDVNKLKICFLCSLEIWNMLKLLSKFKAFLCHKQTIFLCHKQTIFFIVSIFLVLSYVKNNIRWFYWRILLCKKKTNIDVFYIKLRNNFFLIWIFLLWNLKPCNQPQAHRLI